ncbi:MAG: DUF1775 domain-containing protein [Phyllobacterium sp.]
MNKTILPAAGLALLAVFANAAAAQAHASLEKAEAKNDTTYKAVLRVPHGCEGKATNEVRIKLPEGFISAQPMPKSGWDVEIIKGDYAKTYKSHGEDVKSGAVEIRWKGGDLPDEFYDEFIVRGTLTGFEKDTAIYFPATQLCGDTSVKWEDIPVEGQNPHSLKNPAPQLKVLAASSVDHAAHGSSHAGQPVKVGDLELKGFYTRAMLPGAKVAGGYVSITNAGKADDRLLGGTTPAAGRLEVHEMTMQGDVMNMRKLADGIAIPAGETVELKPGGLHMMFFEIPEPFKEGATVPVALEFEKAGKIDLVLPVTSAKGKAGGEHQH